MTKAPLFTSAGKSAGEIELNMEVFGLELNHDLLRQAVMVTLANNRQGTVKVKTRAEVKHTTKKVWRQKGTGRARQGMKSAPHWKGGGVVFGPSPRDFSMSFPKKMRRKALLTAMSARAEENGIIIVENYDIKEGKTKYGVEFLKALGLENTKLLLVLDEPTEELILAFRNIPNVYMATVDSVGTYDVLTSDKILFTKAGLDLFAALKLSPLGIDNWVELRKEESND